MHWCRRAWNYVRQKVGSAVELAREHVVITSLSAGASVGSVVHYSLHSINATVSGNIALFQISSLNGYWVGLTSAAFTPIALVTGGAVCLLIISLALQNDRQRIVAITAVNQQQADEIVRLRAERRVADVVLNAHEIAVVTENTHIITELEQLREEVRELNVVQVDAGLAGRQEIEKLRQAVNMQDGVINRQNQRIENLEQALHQLKLANAANLVPGAAPAVRVVNDLAAEPAGAPPPVQDFQGVRQRRVNAFR